MLPQPPFLARPVLTTMGANMAGEEYTPTLTEGGSPQASPQSEPHGPGMERGASPVLESPAFSPEDGFGPDALNAQPRSNPPAPPSAPPQPVPSPTPGVDPSPEEGDDWGPELMARGSSFEKASFGWGCFWIRGACLWNSWECSGGEPFPSSWRGVLSRTALDQGPEGGIGPPLEGSEGGRDWAFSPPRRRASATAFPFLWDPRECGRHVGFRVGGRQYSWASFAGFGKPFWIDWWSDGTSWDSSPFRGWGSNTSSCQGDGGLSGGTFPEASHGGGCYPNNGRRNSLEPVVGQSSGWERSCRARVENFGLRAKQAHSGVHASAFGGARVPIERPEEPSRQHGCHALYYQRRILLPELPAGTSGLQATATFLEGWRQRCSSHQPTCGKRR